MAVVRDADAAGIDVERVSDPPSPLQVRVPASQERRLAAEIERPAKRIIDEGELSLGVATDDDIALVVLRVSAGR